MTWVSGLDKTLLMKIPHEKLNPETLRGVVSEFVSREGTDYGHSAISHDKKITQVISGLNSGRYVLCFDQESESCQSFTSEVYISNDLT